MIVEIGSVSRPLAVAIIGSGPSGFYAAEHLLKQEILNIEVDMFERLPTPYGLVRAGVAPDHQQIKSVQKVYDKVAQNDHYRFWGNVTFGKDLLKSDFLKYFDAIIYAVGAQSDRSMNIKGEELKGSFSATEFVGWYNGHPDYKSLKFDFSGENVVIIGIGNVAIDVARILAKTVKELANTDIAQHALDQLAGSKIKNIYLVARRGPLQSAFTPAGTKGLLNMTEAVAYVNPNELIIEEETKKIIEDTNDKRILQNLKFLDQISTNNPNEYNRVVQFLFRRSPIEIFSTNNKVSGISIVKNELFEDEQGFLNARATDVCENINTHMVFRSIGYKLDAIKDVPHDNRKGIISNINGRVFDSENNKILKNEYVTGWAKRGPSGVIGTNKPDATETVNYLLEDFKNQKAEKFNKSQAIRIEKWLDNNNINYVPFNKWLILDSYEVESGLSKEKPREKITSVKEMLNIIKE